MNKNKVLALIVIIGGLFTSCTVTTKTVSSKIMKIDDTGIVQNPLIVDLVVTETKVSAQAEGLRLNLDVIRNEVTAHLLDSLNADVLIEPIFKSVHNGNRITVKVSGYPATYTNFRNLRQEDINIINSRDIIIDKTTSKETKL